MTRVLTAEICARAIVGAARSFRDNPIAACTAKGGPKRRSVTVAAHALIAECGVPAHSAFRILKLGMSAYSAPERMGVPFTKALHEARAEIAKATT